jgi:hypothetical protein
MRHLDLVSDQVEVIAFKSPEVNTIYLKTFANCMRAAAPTRGKVRRARERLVARCFEASCLAGRSQPPSASDGDGPHGNIVGLDHPY